MANINAPTKPEAKPDCPPATGSTAMTIAPGTWVQDLDTSTRWMVWGTNRQGITILYNRDGVVTVRDVNRLIRIGPP